MVAPMVGALLSKALPPKMAQCKSSFPSIPKKMEKVLVWECFEAGWTNPECNGLLNRNSPSFYKDGSKEGCP